MDTNFQIVRTPAGWHARWRGNNNEIVWTTEVYESKEAAEQAILLITSPTVGMAFAQAGGVRGVEVVEERDTED